MRLEAYKQELYELRFSPMCKPAGEVANLTLLESHTTRARMMMLWRIAEGHLDWGEREVELLYQSTLDSISEAFDVFHYPISRFMLDARADVWEAGLAPENVRQVVRASLEREVDPYPEVDANGVLVLAGEIAQLDDDEDFISPLKKAMEMAGFDSAVWIAPTGTLAYTLGAWEAARQQARAVLRGIEASRANIVIADGPETAWALLKVYPALGLTLPDGVQVRLLSQTLADRLTPSKRVLDTVFVHDSRPGYYLSESPPNHLAVMPGFSGEASSFGAGPVYDAPRRLLDRLGAKCVAGTWQRGLAKSCGADDGLWLTYPELAEGLARQRLDYACELGAEVIVSDSPLCVSWLTQNAKKHDLSVSWLTELMIDWS